MRDSTPSITSLPPSPDRERHSRMIRYGITMGIRVVCLFLCVIIPPGWWLVFPAIGAIFLPYVAVVIANASRRGTGTTPERPGTIERMP